MFTLIEIFCMKRQLAYQSERIEQSNKEFKDKQRTALKASKVLQSQEPQDWGESASAETKTASEFLEHLKHK